MNKMDEQIVVVPRQTLFGANDEGAFQGLTAAVNINVDIYEQHIKGKTQVLRRGDMEQDPSYKQLIPYVVLRSVSEPTDGETKEENIQLFTYKRLEGGGEERLHNKLSVGIGGHMNEFVDFSSWVDEAIREINEELVLETVDEDKETYTPADAASLNYSLYGYINDDSDDVGKVHLGIVMIVDVPKDISVEVRETEQLEGQWRTLEELLKPHAYDRLENWSKLVVDKLA